MSCDNSWLSSSLIILGWIVVNHQSNFRETRKEKRTQLNELSGQLSNLMADAISFHCGESYCQRLAFTLRNDIQAVIKAAVNLRLLKPEDIRLLKDLRVSITLKNFEEHIWVRQAYDSDVLKEIAAAKISLLSALEGRFSTGFCLTLPQAIWHRLDVALGALKKYWVDIRNKTQSKSTPV